MTTSSPVPGQVSSLETRLRAVGAAHEWQWIRPLANAEEVVGRREKGEPLAYILGSWAFRDFEFAVGPGALIPRPETEEMIDLVLAQLGEARPLTIADLGAGTGCIGLSIFLELAQRPAWKQHFSQSRLIMVEKSAEAREYLRKNVTRHGPALAGLRFEFAPQSWNEWKPVHESFDAIVSNPPYITEEEYASLDESVRAFEPKAALCPDDESATVDASKPYAEIVALAAQALKPGGFVICEHGPAQKIWLNSQKWDLGLWAKITVEKDMSGKERFLLARKAKDGQRG